MFTAMSLGVAEEAGPLFKNQRLSSIKWGEINIKSFLSLKEWKDKSDEQDRTPKWETIARERNNREVVGRFFQCAGKCRIDRGQGFFNPRFKTEIYEGDEVQTIGESYAWIFLLDGTMVRLAPESSINFNELNIGAKENFLNARVNVGNILWLSRYESLFEEQNVRETDVLFNPLALYEALPISDKKQYEEDDLIELVSPPQAILNQYKKLNELIEKNNKWIHKKKTYAFIVMPNITIMGHNPSVEMVSILGGKSFFKKRSPLLLGLKVDETLENDEVLIQMRGFENSELTKLESDVWLEVDAKGRSLAPALDNIHWLTMGEFITKRIPSLLVARELLLTQYSQFAFQEKYDPTILAIRNGYRLWSQEDYKLRLSFLKEYFRRSETTNLLVTAQFSDRLKEVGEAIKSMEYGNYFFIKALDKYYSYDDYNQEKESGEVLNSTTKILWKRMHGIR